MVVPELPEGERVLVTRLLDRLVAAGQTLAVAESLTGGLLAATITDVPGASQVFRGGLVAYQNDVKATKLGVPAALLAGGGAVQEGVVSAMASGVRTLLDAWWGLATTGVAGPGHSDGHPPGTVFIGVSGEGVQTVRRLALSGGRGQVRRATVAACLALLGDALERYGCDPPAGVGKRSPDRTR